MLLNNQFKLVVDCNLSKSFDVATPQLCVFCRNETLISNDCSVSPAIIWKPGFRLDVLDLER